MWYEAVLVGIPVLLPALLPVGRELSAHTQSASTRHRGIARWGLLYFPALSVSEPSVELTLHTHEEGTGHYKLVSIFSMKESARPRSELNFHSTYLMRLYEAESHFCWKGVGEDQREGEPTFPPGSCTIP